MSTTSGESSREDILGCVKNIGMQLCRVASGDFSFVVKAGAKEPVVQELEMICNLVLDRARRKIAESELILRHAAIGIVTIDANGIIFSFNKSAEEIFGYAADEVLGRGIGILMPAPHCDAHDSYLLHYLETGEPRLLGRPVETCGRRRDGSEFPLHLHVNEVSRHPTRFSAIVRDLSHDKRRERERQNLEVQLNHARKLESVGQLAAGIAHEINTPTQYVGDNTRFLQDSFQDLLPILKTVGALAHVIGEAAEADAEARELLTAIEDADLEYLSEEIPRAIEQTLEGVQRVSRIVLAMKEFSHPGAEGMTSVDLNHAIESTVTVATNEWKYVATVQTELDPELPPVSCLPGEINQVILNMIVNAAHAIADVVGKDEREKGTITIKTRRDGGVVEIRISDTGTGIPEHARDRIFDPFFTTKGVGKGTGQGLAIAHNVVVQKHGGTLGFETEMGRGTTFVIRLPIEQASSESMEGAA